MTIRQIPGSHRTAKRAAGVLVAVIIAAGAPGGVSGPWAKTGCAAQAAARRIRFKRVFMAVSFPG